MKKITYLLAIVLFTVFSCSKSDVSQDTLAPIEEEAKGNFSLSFTPKTINSGKSLKSSKELNETPFEIIATITDEFNNIVINNKRYTLTNFNGSFITSIIELPIGEYTLTGFNVTNSDNEIIFSAPLVDSEFAELVNNPLPISFAVSENNSSNNPKNISPEVLRVEPEDTAEQFGYVTFSFNIVETINLYIQVLENGDNINDAGAIAKIGNIPDNNFITRTLIDGVNTVKIPLNDFNSNVIELEISYLNYDTKNLSLDPATLDNYSVDDPFLISFNTVVTPDPTTLTPIISEVLFQNRSSLNSIADSENTLLFNDLNLLDIDKDSFNQYYISSSVNTESVLIHLNRESSGASFIKSYTSQDKLGFFNKVHTSSTDYILSGGGQIYRFKNFTDNGLTFTKFNYNKFNDNLFDNIFVANKKIYAFSGNKLYRSDNLGETFKLINTNLPFTIQNTTFENNFAYTEDSIYIIINGQIYSSNNAGESFSEFSNLGIGYSSIYIKNDRIHAFGGINASFQTGTITSGEKSFTPTRSFDPDDGNFVGFLINNGDDQNNVYFTNTHYKGLVFGNTAQDILNNLALEKKVTITPSIKEIIIGPFNNEIIAISDNAIHFNLQ